jgi:hypothetical protein
VLCKHSAGLHLTLHPLPCPLQIQDGERLPLAVKDLGSCDLYPQSLAHNPNGRFVVVCGDGEYIVYTALAWRNKSFGSAADFVWSPDSNDFAVREGGNKVKIFKNFVVGGEGYTVLHTVLVAGRSAGAAGVVVCRRLEHGCDHMPPGVLPGS